MRAYFWSAGLLFGLLVGLALPLAAQSDVQSLGALSGPFTTLSVMGDLAYPGELDWFTFDIVEASTPIVLLVEGVESDSSIRALLFDAEDAYIDTTEDGLLESVLESGTYRVRIDSIDSAVQSYSLVVLNGLEVESNDGLIEANDLGELSGSVQLFASILPEGDADFYRFRVSENGLPDDANALLIRTNGNPGGDTFMVLYRYNEASQRYLPIASDDDSGNGYWSQLLLRAMPSERFALRIEEAVFPLEGLDRYNLSVIPVSLTTDEEPNNTSAQAADLIPDADNAFAWTVDGVLDIDDEVDFFAITLDSAALLQIYTEAQGNVGDYDTFLSLYTSDGTLLSESDDSGESGWSRLSQSLEAGQYFVTVEIGDYAATPLPYRLRATAMSVRTISETEPNETETTAELVAWEAGEALLIEAAINPEGDVDSFKLVLSEARTVIVETGPRSGTSASNDTTLTIYDEDLWEIAFNDDSTGSWSRLEQMLAAGTYFIVVESYYDDETFDYSVLITSAD